MNQVHNRFKQLAIAGCCALLASVPSLAQEVKVGVLHSLSGTMAISEDTVKNSTLLAIDQINASGGVLGKKIVPVIEDGSSAPAIFSQKAQKLIQEDKVVTVFGGWTSASRKAMLPVFERFHSLLWYPVQFEGNECSSNIMYSGAQPNQQILPALDYAFQNGKKKVFLLGSDYVFPRTANLILKKHILKNGGTVSGEEYVPLGGTDFSAIITKIKIAKPDVVFSTVNGDSNVSFFKQLAAAGISQQQLPIFSFSIAEQEAKAMGTSLVAGGFTAWNYFESLKNPKNAAFIAAYKAKYGKDAVLDDPMVHGYIDVLVWAAAVKKAGSFDPDAVRKAATQLASTASPLGEIKFAENQSLFQTAYVGQFLPDGQVKVVWQSKGALHPDPYDALAFPGKTCVVK